MFLGALWIQHWFWVPYSQLWCRQIGSYELLCLLWYSMTHQVTVGGSTDVPRQQVLLANNSWQSCSATTDAAAEEVLGQFKWRNPTESDGPATVFSFLCNSHVRSRSVRGSIDSKWILYRLWVEKAWHIFWKSTWRSLNHDFFEKNWFQAVGSQVSSSPTALAAQVVTVVSLAAAGAFPCDQDVIRPKVSMISLLPQIISVWCHAIGVWVKAWGTFQESFYNAAFVDFETF